MGWRNEALMSLLNEVSVLDAEKMWFGLLFSFWDVIMSENINIFFFFTSS